MVQELDLEVSGSESCGDIPHTLVKGACREGLEVNAQGYLIDRWWIEGGGEWLR